MQGKKWLVYYVIFQYYNVICINMSNMYVPNNIFVVDILTYTFYKYFVLFLVVYPIIHFTEDRNLLMSLLQDQNEINEHFKLHQGESSC